jgi:hypothetical protein
MIATKTDYTVLMVREALSEARPHISKGNWVRINGLGPNVRLHIGRFNHDGARKPTHLTVSYYIENDGTIGREELVF